MLSKPKLAQLLGSNTRLQLLFFFFAHPRQKFWVRQITRLVNLEISAVRLELAKLKKIGLLSQEVRGRKLWYWLKTDSPLFAPLQYLFLKTTGLGGEIWENRQRLGEVKLLFLTGRFLLSSLPKETIDLLAVGRVILPELEELIRQEEKRRGWEINWTVMGEKEFSWRKRRQDPFLTQILSQPRVLIIGSEEALAKL